jgi:zinc protease
MGKGGTMALLSDQLFPDPETRDFFAEELGGSLRVTIDFDAVTILMTGRATEFERMLEFLRTALISTPISDQSVTKLRDLRLKMIREMTVSSSVIADLAIARRLYGDFPYGRPAGGIPDTLATVDRNDLLLARERFHTPDNGTLVVIGGVQGARALRALRQLLGAWRKSDKLVPSTFRMQDAPDPRTLIVDIPAGETADVRLAVRSLTRSDPDYPIATLLTLLLRDRWLSGLPELNRSTSFVRNESYLLSGMLVMGASVRTTETSKVLESARNTLRVVADAPPTVAELDRIRSEVVANLNKSSSNQVAIANMWLDAETYKLALNGDQIPSVNKITPADIKRVATRLFRDATFASIAVGNAAQLRSELERTGKVEVLGENIVTQPTGAKTPTKSP